MKFLDEFHSYTTLLMQLYLVGWHQPNKGLSGTYLFSRRKIPVFISVRRLWKRRSRFPAHKWILDSGAFKELELKGKYSFTLIDYAREIIRWWTPTMLAAVAPDFMCEGYIFAQREKHTGVRYTVVEHQRLTVYNYKALRKILPVHIYLMPVLQGFTPDEYVDCIRLYGEDLEYGMWVGVGSLCKRQRNPRHTEEVLKAIKNERPDLKLHGFGVKKASLLKSATVVDLLHSADSQAHNFTGKRKPGDKKFHSGNDPKNAIAYYYSIINHLYFKPMEVQEILQQCTVQENNVVKLPNRQLERKTYLEVAQKINLIGGKWKGGKISGFVFEEDPTELLQQIANGDKRNLKKEYQFFETPDLLADEVVSLAEIDEEDKTLEPTAGRGALIKAVNRILPDKMVDCYELMEINQTYLKKLPTANFLGADFLENNGTCYDRIIANPPFSKNQDIIFIQEMYKLLNPGGRIVSIASTHWQHSSNKLETSFKSWLKVINAEVHSVEPGAFASSGTNVATCIIVINRSPEDLVLLPLVQTAELNEQN